MELYLSDPANGPFTDGWETKAKGQVVVPLPKDTDCTGKLYLPVSIRKVWNKGRYF